MVASCGEITRPDAIDVLATPNGSKLPQLREYLRHQMVAGCPITNRYIWSCAVVPTTPNVVGARHYNIYNNCSKETM
ncbi:hypothetical protein GOP47_0005087 [Adiantum capillus-veneris]|uniref:Uncharacterized protein n=1 Tax=Adiantum capillus-veneris TaxID=13818 RepID=A0A9D4V5K4_ADICA|nr:hypothetical protein GOP47_0005087 [Adiantum capillus-veneris]